MCHMSHVRCSMSLSNHSQTVRAMDQLIVSKCSPYHTTPYHHVSWVPYHMSDVTFTCHLSCITSQVSHVTHFFFFLFFQKVVELDCGGSVINGATPSSFQTFSYKKNSLTPKIYLFQLVVVCFWSLKKQIDENLISERLDQTASARSGEFAHVRTRRIVHVFKSQTLESINFFLTQTWVFFFRFFGRFFRVKSCKKVFKSSKKL